MGPNRPTGQETRATADAFPVRGFPDPVSQYR
jgi:hypothetical protein